MMMPTRSNLYYLLILLTSIGSGCATAAAQQDPATESPTTTMATTQPSGTVTLHLSDAVAADDLERNDWEVDMQSQIPFTDRPLLFGQLSVYGNDDTAKETIPVVGFKQGDKLMALKIDDPRLVNAGWSYIAAGPTLNEIWGLLDASLDDHQPDVVIVHSTDSGKTLQISSLPKPLPVAAFDSFCMDARGHGRLSLYVYRDQAKLKRAGYYHYRTTDGGKNWTGPEREPDGMLPADDAPADNAEPAKRPAKA